MAAVPPLYNLISSNIDNLSKKELFILDALLFARIIDQLINIFKEEYRNYLSILKSDTLEEKCMLEESLISLLLEDIIKSGAYTLEGLALYTNTPKDVLIEIMTGINKRPAEILYRRVMELHQQVRPNLYSEIIKKITKT